MMYLKKKISIISLFFVTFVAFFGIICPMQDTQAMTGHESGCASELTTISSLSNPEMGDCMSGKISFLNKYLAPIPQEFAGFILLIGLYVVAILSATKILEISKVRNGVIINRLIYDYFSKIKVVLDKRFLYWSTLKSHPVLIA